MIDILNGINGILWATPLIVLILGGGLLFTLRSGLAQFRYLPRMISLTLKGDPGVVKDKTQKSLTAYQALSMTLASAIGVGNIAGVATAITFGGPGAVFWMWVMALLGAGTSIIENTLGQIYKEDLGGGEFRGGPAYYLERATNKRIFGVLFAVATLLAYGWALYTPQTNAMAETMQAGFGIPPLATGIVSALIFAVIVFGGAKRIGEFAAMVVPVMALAYVVLALIILGKNTGQIPATFSLIFRSAFNAEAALGGMVGAAIQWGVKRGIFSNEAGQGTSPHSGAAANVSHPLRQGLMQSLAVYVDTIIVCTATALMILITGSYNVVTEAGTILINNVGDIPAGALNTQMAIDSAFPGFGAKFLALAVWFFTFTSCIVIAFYAESNAIYLMKRKDDRVINALRVLGMSAMIFGAAYASDIVWALTDFGLGLMSWVNVLGLIVLHPIVIKTIKDYERQTRSGIENPVFDPVKLDIKHAKYWENRLEEEKIEELVV